MASLELEDEIKEYARQLQRRKEFVSMTCGAEFRNSRKCNTSGLLILDDEYYPLLKTKLLEFGQIGERINKTSIGCCAEVNASNEIYKMYKIKLNEISLSKAYRPKTMQVREKCDVCNSVFY